MKAARRDFHLKSRSSPGGRPCALGGYRNLPEKSPVDYISTHRMVGPLGLRRIAGKKNRKELPSWLNEFLLKRRYMPGAFSSSFLRTEPRGSENRYAHNLAD
jgi:hypothetical protein